MKESAATDGLVHKTFPTEVTFLGDVGMTLIAPGGILARSHNKARASAENGASSDGLITTVQPAASAAHAFLVTIAAG